MGLCSHFKNAGNNVKRTLPLGVEFPITWISLVWAYAFVVVFDDMKMLVFRRRSSVILNPRTFRFFGFVTSMGLGNWRLLLPCSSLAFQCKRICGWYEFDFEIYDFVFLRF